MDPPPRRPTLPPLLLLALLCASCGSRHPPLQAGLAAAIAALPWDRDTTGTGAFCSAEAVCDTLLIEPRVVRLPHPAPAFFLPASRPLVLNLSTPPVADLRSAGRPVRFADWGECLARRHDASWSRAGHACVALALAEGTTPSDTVRLALLVISPARGLVWPRLQLIPDGRRWRVDVVSVGGE
jgi:hypothetical protein